MTKTAMKIEPFWNEAEKEPNYAPLNADVETDICIIGAGIAGLSTAYQLLTLGKRVVVLEADQLTYGETGRSSAHLTNALDDRYFRIEKMHGAPKAKLAAQSHSEAIDWIEAVVAKEHIDCAFKRTPGYLFVLGANKEELIKEYEACQRVGIDVKLTEEPKLGKCLQFKNQGRFHPQKYLQGLAKAVTRLGGKIYERSQVANIDFAKSEVVLANQHQVKAQNIVIATNAPKFSPFSMHLKISPQRTYIIGLKIPKGSVSDALYWDTENPYHYVRIQPYNSESDLLIIGGEDHRVGVVPEESPFINLQQWAEHYFSVQVDELVYRWSGQILEPIDYMAYIGRHPKYANAYLVTGDSGNGLTHGTIAAILISDLMVKGEHPYAELYRVDRLPARAIKKLLTNAWASMMGYIKHAWPQWGKAPNIGEGKILQHGLRKIAVYKDEDTKLNICSGTCSHMGAVLRWNPIEKTWDCPAHGSRFDVNGHFINGPANQALNCPVHK